MNVFSQHLWLALYKQLVAWAALTIESVVNIISCCEGGTCPLGPPKSAPVSHLHFSLCCSFLHPYKYLLQVFFWSCDAFTLQTYRRNEYCGWRTLSQYCAHLFYAGYSVLVSKMSHQANDQFLQCCQQIKSSHFHACTYVTLSGLYTSVTFVYMSRYRELYHVSMLQFTFNLSLISVWLTTAFVSIWLTISPTVQHNLGAGCCPSPQDGVYFIIKRNCGSSFTS